MLDLVRARIPRMVRIAVVDQIPVVVTTLAATLAVTIPAAVITPEVVLILTTVTSAMAINAD